MVIVVHKIKIDIRTDSRGQIKFRLEPGPKSCPTLKAWHIRLFQSVMIIPAYRGSLSESVSHGSLKIRRGAVASVVDPVDKSVVVVEDEAALADGPDVLVLDTASCAGNVDDDADRRRIADKRADSLLISRINRSGSSLGGSKKRATTNNQYPIGGSFRSIEIPSSPGACKDRDRAERATGIEPAWPAWKAGTLPLSYARAPN